MESLTPKICKILLIINRKKVDVISFNILFAIYSFAHLNGCAKLNYVNLRKIQIAIALLEV